jgi:hypothetical protein
MMNINQINIKQYMETFEWVESPNVDKIFESKILAPNLKQRR